MRTPDTIAADIAEARKRAHGLSRQFVAALREMGELLIEAEKTIEPGDWPKWLQEDAFINERLAHHYMSAATEPQFEVEQRAIRGALDIFLSDEVVIPDERHIVRASDIWMNRLFIWPARDGSGFYAMAFDRQRNKYSGNRQPVPKEHLAEIIAANLRGLFELANAAYEVMGATAKDLDALDDMRARHLDRVEEDAA